ncbi:hypothetical protein ACOSQ2_022967 [Xanthoceras sorbifolium]
MVRNGNGILCAAASWFFCGGWSVEVAEATALLEGLKFAFSRNLFPLEVESDALNIVNLCKGVSHTRSDVDSIVFDVKFLLSSFDCISISFVPRSCNGVAHGVAKRVLFCNSSVVWLFSFSDWLLKLVLDDSMFVVGPVG